MNPLEMKPYERLWAAMMMGAKDGRLLSRFGEQTLALLTPTNLLIMAVILAAWTLGTAFGGPVGIVVDIGLYGVAILTLGRDALAAMGDSARFVVYGLDAKTEADLRDAGRYFADALLTVGPDLVLALFGSAAFATSRSLVLRHLKVPKLQGLAGEPPPAPKPKPVEPPAGPRPAPEGLPGPRPGEAPPPRPGEPAAKSGEPARAGEPARPNEPAAKPKSGVGDLVPGPKDLALGAGAGGLAKEAEWTWLALPIGVIVIAALAALLLSRKKQEVQVRVEPRA